MGFIGKGWSSIGLPDIDSRRRGQDEGNSQPAQLSDIAKGFDDRRLEVGDNSMTKSEKESRHQDCENEDRPLRRKLFS